MGTVLPATVPQTLYVTVRRDELRQLREERDQLQKRVAQMAMMLQHAHIATAGTALQA
ncbi:MAG TPA: DUF6026 family protein [Pseudomonas sp.]|nr:DUF6026 family protein [Pseudomonas sp.]